MYISDFEGDFRKLCKYWTDIGKLGMMNEELIHNFYGQEKQLKYLK